MKKYKELDLVYSHVYQALTLYLRSLSLIHDYEEVVESIDNDHDFTVIITKVEKE
jgi:hypothetical protein